MKLDRDEIIDWVMNHPFDAADKFMDFHDALYRIAAFDDKGASERLEITGSLSSFDEPGSVKMARDALRQYKP